MNDVQETFIIASQTNGIYLNIKQKHQLKSRMLTLVNDKFNEGRR